jgi:rod shape determining protein RodA
MKLIKHLKRLDWWMFGSAIALTSCGLLSIGFFSRQLIFLGIAILAYFFFSWFDWRALKSSWIVLALYFLSLASLIGLFFVAPVKGVHRWYSFGSISFDPKELAKIALIILLAKYFSQRHQEMYNIKHIILTGFYAALPALLIFLQPDLGSSLIIVFIWLSVLLIVGAKKHHLIGLIVLFIICSVIAWSFFIKDYQKDRLTGFLDPEVDPLGSSWSQNQARIAIGSGGWFGRGINRGPQTRQGFLPEPKTDFIFSAWAEETGFIGVSFLLLLFVVLIGRIIRIALRAGNNFIRLFASATVVHIVIQIFINIGMNTSMLPVIGTPLPFVSYGGSGLLFLFIALGLMESMRAGGQCLPIKDSLI